MWRAEILRALADYASALTDGLNHCSREEDRPTFVNALAFAGILLGKIHDEEPYPVLKQLVDAEEKNVAWTYLSGDDGKVAEEAWAVFRRTFETALEDQPDRRGSAGRSRA
jgi:hypothetical protein